MGIFGRKHFIGIFHLREGVLIQRAWASSPLLPLFSCQTNQERNPFFLIDKPLSWLVDQSGCEIDILSLFSFAVITGFLLSSAPYWQVQQIKSVLGIPLKLTFGLLCPTSENSDLWCHPDLQRGAALLAVTRKLTLWIRNYPLFWKSHPEFCHSDLFYILQLILCRVLHQYNKFRLRDRTNRLLFPAREVVYFMCSPITSYFRAEFHFLLSCKSL